MLKAGVAAALGLTLLIPTFNALNYSYVEGAKPPEWLLPDDPPPPPKDFKPPEDWTPPEDWQPPEDWEPPEDYEDYMDEYEGEYPFATPPACPPPVFRDLEVQPNGNWSLNPNRDSRAFTMQVPNYTLGVGGWVNTTGTWQGTNLRVVLSTGQDNRSWDESVRGNTGGLLGPTSNPQHSFKFRSDDAWGTEEAPPWGRYDLVVSGDFPIDIRGTVKFRVLIACGGIAS